MAERVNIVGQSLKDGIGQLQVLLPESQLPHSAVGSLVSRNLGERYGLKTDSQVVSMPSDRKSQIALARDIYYTEPIVANSIDLMVDLCANGMQNHSEDPSSKQFFDFFCKYADFDELHRQMFYEYFISGDINIVRGAKVAVDKKTIGIKGIKKPFYFTYTVVDPLAVEWVGSYFFGQSYAKMTPSSSVQSLFSDQYASELVKQFPSDMKSAFSAGKTYYPKVGTIGRITKKKPAYEQYPTPYLSRVFAPVQLKRRMREADLALAETVRMVLVTYTIGSDERPAQQSDLDALAALLESPSKSMELVWNHTLKVSFHYPNAALFDDSKYKQVNQDIREGLGLPSSINGGTEGTFSSSWSGFAVLIDRLESARRAVVRWQEEEYRRVANDLGLKFKAIPSVHFNALNLRDDKTFKNMLLQAWDRGLLSDETLLDACGQDIIVEMANRIAEKDGGADDAFEPRAKNYAKSGTTSDTTTNTTTTNNPSPTGGRPTDTVDPGSYTPRDSTDTTVGPSDQETTQQ